MSASSVSRGAYAMTDRVACLPDPCPERPGRPASAQAAQPLSVTPSEARNTEEVVFLALAFLALAQASSPRT